MTIELSNKQKKFCDTRLRAIKSKRQDTGIKGIEHHAYKPMGKGAFVVRDLNRAFIADFGNFDEAVAELLVVVYNFKPLEADVVDAVITYLDAEGYLQ